jgi:hypothetical protein
MTYFSRFSWYARRLGRMSPGEVAWRVREQALRSLWARRQVRPEAIPDGFAGLRVLDDRWFSSALPPGTADLVPSAAHAAVVAAADRILKGEWEMLGVVRTDMDAPDWFWDPVTGRRSTPSRYAFRVNHRSETEVGNVKQVWEVSRLQHLTLLACAYYLTGTEAYAFRAATALAGWWRANPFLSGVNWTSGIEVGVRAMNFVWIRRLLSDWPGVGDLFEHNDLALRQIRWHQEYLAAFESRGSSANNHVIAEAAGQLAVSCAFPWFPESERWRRASADLLARSLRLNTFPSGINRELATDYHGFVFELGTYAAAEASAAGFPCDHDTWDLLCRMADAMAALVDETGRPPRQGDSDEGRVVLLDAPEHNRWPELLSVASVLFGPLDWWPATSPRVAGIFTGALTGPHPKLPGRPHERPTRFADAGITLLRTAPGGHRRQPEIWVRCDGGPHGFLSIAAHAHADALSVEVRCGGVDILADPGTYCYHGEPEWRSYFRSTIAHNTIEIGGHSQSEESGPFMWQRQARTREVPVPDPDFNWVAEHDGYTALRPPARHRRRVRLDPATRSVEITDELNGGGAANHHSLRLAFHLGPDVSAELSGDTAMLTWRSGTAGSYDAVLSLPGRLDWTLHRGDTEPILGWYSAGLGSREPSVTLVGRSRNIAVGQLITTLRFTGTANLVEAK